MTDVYDPHSKVFHHYLAQAEIADRFGPSQSDYDSVLSYLRSEGFALTQGSTNCLTITVRGTRAAAERTFETPIADYRLGDRNLYANQIAPRAARRTRVACRGDYRIVDDAAPAIIDLGSARGTVRRYRQTVACHPRTKSKRPPSIRPA